MSALPHSANRRPRVTLVLRARRQALRSRTNQVHPHQCVLPTVALTQRAPFLHYPANPTLSGLFTLCVHRLLTISFFLLDALLVFPFLAYHSGHHGWSVYRKVQRQGQGRREVATPANDLRELRLIQHLPLAIRLRRVFTWARNFSCFASVSVNSMSLESHRNPRGSPSVDPFPKSPSFGALIARVLLLNLQSFPMPLHCLS